MFLVKAKTTMVVIGERVFSPVLATPFHGELPSDVAGRDDLLHIEEVPDEQPAVEPGGLSATGTLQTDDSEGDAGALGASDDQGPASDPAILTDEALTSGVALITVGDDDDDDTGGNAQTPDPFADPAEQAPAPKSAPAGNGGRGGKK